MLARRSDQGFLWLLRLFDVIVTAAAWVGAYFFRWGTGFFPVVKIVPPFSWCAELLPMVMLVALLSYQVSGIYQLGRRWSIWGELGRILKGTSLMLLLVLAVNFYKQSQYESRLVSVTFFVSTTLGMMGCRRLIGLYFRVLRQRGGLTAQALIIGTGRLAQMVDRSLRANNWVGIQPMGFVDDPPAVQRANRPMTVGNLSELAELIDKHKIDYVFVALPLERAAETKRILRRLSNTLVEVRVVPDLPSQTSFGVNVAELEGMPVLTLRSSCGGFSGIVAKRTMDIAFSLIGIILLMPLMTLIALIVKLSDGGPIFYFQERMGINGRRFNMLKFRTMRVNAESDTGPVWAQAGDKRRTRLGAFLRESSIDELPQLFNVLKGDMSLVGPRPERPYFISNFQKTIPKYMLRHAVKSGITGWAQIHGWRGNTSLRKRVQYDLYYISNWSLWLDVRILFATVFRVIWERKNAY